ncbi:SLAM family member 9-like isoform X2 [Echinops telfairi]|uniref:SLAM family member 9-like isoform X2 n=1 Tax=Echinops telfairi TaxID=9371 RepID=A0AC55DRN9_ECHTE|nr:SLAM family member 9-like isoform X2 [Echinops telfairi]
MDRLFSRSFPNQIQMLMLSLLIGVQAVKDPWPPCTLNRAVGESAQLQLNFSEHSSIREIEWNWNSGDEKNQLLVSWKLGGIEWYDFDEKYKHRFHLAEMAFLNISNLIVEMNGLYEAKIKYHSGQFEEDVIRLCVYELILHPKILTHSSLSTSDWCNITLECVALNGTKDLTVTWLDKGLPGQLELRDPLGPAPTYRNLSLSLPLPLSQGNSHLTCMVSNPVDQKNVTLDLGGICLWMDSLWSKWIWKCIFPMVLVVSLGVVGVYIWKRRQMEPERGPSSTSHSLIVPPSEHGGSSLLPGGPSSAAAHHALPTENSVDLYSRKIDNSDYNYCEIGLLRRAPRRAVGTRVIRNRS